MADWFYFCYDSQGCQAEVYERLNINESRTSRVVGMFNILELGGKGGIEFL